MKKKQLNILFLIVLICMLIMPLWEMSYRYVWDPGSGKLASSFTDSGIFKNLWAELTHDYESIVMFGFNPVFPVIYLGILTQLFFIFRKNISIKTAIWLYIGNLMIYIIGIVVFISAFDSHAIEFYPKIGTFLFIAPMIGGIIKEKKSVKPHPNK